MKYSQARLGRVFTVRLEDGDVVHESLQRLAKEEGVQCAAVLLVGGADQGSRVVVGPVDGRAHTVRPMEHVLAGAHEVVGAGTLFPTETGEPVLHLHAAFGRGAETVTGCARLGVVTWLVGEAIVIELLDNAATRRRDDATGFQLLEV